jgi:hypothetical protein
LRTHKKKIESKIGANAHKFRFTDRESDTHEVKPRKGRVARKSTGLVLTLSDQHHRSVLEDVDERKRVVKCT